MMRLNPRVLLAVLGILLGAAAGVAQSPNFSSLTTQVQVLTVDSSHPLRVTYPLPYREPRRTLRAPIPADEFDEVWSISDRGIDPHTGHAATGGR
jgi:hypothetical protein